MAAGSGLNQKYKYECEQSSNNGELSDSVLDYADYCQFILEMDSWPAQSLCTEMAGDAAFSLVLGDYCDPECFFGTKNGGNTCICNKGYWNTSCNTECPGGAAKPCSGYGTCDNSGTCDCPLNKQGANDCSVCSTDWIGSDCEIAENKVTGNTYIAMASQLGHMTSMDGLNFIVREASVYTLLTISDVLVIQGKYVICHQNYTCITFLSVRLGDLTNAYTTMTFKAPKLETDKPTVYIEDQEKSVDDTLYFHGFSLQRLNIDDLKIVMGNNAEIVIRLQGQYLTMEVSLQKQYVNLTSGLLGGSDEQDSSLKLEQLLYREIYSPEVCSYSGSIQTSSSTPISYTLPFNNVIFAKNMSFSSSLDFSRFAVSTCNEFIYYPSVYDKNQNVGGYSLNFRSSIIYGDADLYTGVGPNITFEFLVKIGNESQEGGVLFSFSNTKSFIVQSSESIEMVYENETYTTNMTLQQNEWNKVVVMYYGELGEFDIYIFNTLGYIERRSFVLPTHIFNDPGTLSIGHWQPPYNNKVLAAPVTLNGQIDNFLVWKIPLEPNIVTDIFQINPLDIQHLLNLLWQFDEGQGIQTSDYIQGNVINLPTSPWVSPEWIPSDLYYVKNTYPEVTYIYYRTTIVQTEAEHICSQIIDTTYPSCANMSSATKQIFYSACLQVYSTTKDSASAYSVILNNGRICQISLDLSSSPVLTLCDNLNTTDKENSGCPRTCIYGIKQADDTCTCSNGHYGTVCSSICPGGSDTPCNNNGKCSNLGQCTCVWNWNGAVDCGTCTTGMKGPDCKILYVGTPGTKAFITGKGDYMGFNGYQISLDEIYGVFKVFEDSSSNFAIEAYQVSCVYGSCIIGMSIKTTTTQIVIMPSGQDDKPPIVYKDKVRLDYGITTALSADMVMVLKSYTELEITVSNTNKINIRVQDQWIDTAMNLDSSICSTSSGILGNCAGTSDTYTTYSQEDLMSFIETTYKSVNGPIVETMYAVFGQNVSLNSGFALLFNETSSITETLTYNTNFNSQEFSLSMYFKPSGVGGVILAYSRNTTFTVLNTHPMSMQCGTKTISTTASPHVGEWNQIIITFDESQNQMHFYHYGPNITISYQVINDFCSNLFVEGGKISLGEWIPSYQSEKYTYTKTFIGEIEEASLWKDPIPPALVFQAESLNVKVSGFLNNVSTLWSFSEGVGYLAFDNVVGNDMNLPRFPWQSPAWVVSDKTLKVINDEITLVVETQQEAVDLCTEFFGSVASACSSVSSDNILWFKNQCILLGSATSNVSSSVMAMISFTSFCEITESTVTTLFTKMCSLNTTVPSWVSQVCNNCEFGYKGSDGTCKCYYGFYEASCNQVCPNGITMPCSGKGVCDTSGLCQCEGHWSGLTCDSCATGWEGDECVVMASGQPANQSTLVAQVSINGQMISFDGYAIDLTVKNVYRLFSHSNEKVNIFGHISTCFDTLRTHFCLRDIVFEDNGIFYYIRSSNSFKDTKVVVYTNTDEINVYDKYSSGKIEISISQTNILSITFVNMDLTVKIIYVDNGLIMTTTYANSKWITDAAYIDGLLTSCDTKSAVQLAACSNATRLNLCNGVIDTTNAGSCVSQLNFIAVKYYLNIYVFTNTKVDTILERQYIITGPACLLFNGAGVYVSEVELPSSIFTIEFHAKPITVNGPMLTFHTKDHHTIVVNYKTGIIIIADNYMYETNILLDLNVWNQINLVWDATSYRLEIYLTTYSGNTIVKEIVVPFNIFETGGTLTIGQIGDGVTTLVPIGEYNGYIDEIRIWTRPHNPTIIRQNWRIAITDKTPDLYAVWSLNEGTGYVAADMKKSQHLYMMYYDNKPTWAASDLELSPGIDLKLPQLTTVTPLSTTVDTSNCDDLLKSTEILNACSGLENTISSLYDQCVTLVKTTGNPDLAEVVLLSLSDYCKEAKNLTESPIKDLCNLLNVYNDYVTWYGGSCDSECVFGATASGACTCDASHYGPSCSGICGLGPLGACNSQGTCNASSGQCSCQAHWYGQTVSVSQYWKSFSSLLSITISVTSNSCSQCSVGWYGSDCNFVVQRVDGIHSYAAGFISASYITTLGGASYRLITPGIYNVYSVSGLSVQIVFWPCNNDIYCRQIKEISINSGGQTVSVMRHNETLQPMHIGGSTTFDFPTTTSVSSISIKWIVKEYVRVTVGSFSVLVSDSSIGLICRFKVAISGGTSATGLLGNTDNSWWKDLVSPTDQTNANSSFIDNNLSALYTGSWTKQQFGSSLSSVHTWHTNRQQNLSTSGYLLHLTSQTVTYLNVYSSKDISAFTTSFFVRIQMHLAHQTIVVYQMNGQNLTLSVQNGLLAVDWGSTWTTTLEMTINSWIYISMTWQSSNGQFLVYMMTDGGLQYKAITNVHVSSVLDIEGIFLFGTDLSPLEIDHLRFWKVAKSLDTVLASMTSYVDDITADNELIALIGFDEGTGLTSNMVTLTSSVTSNVKGTITEPETDDLWIPSDIPTDKSYMPKELTPSNVNATVLNNCITALNNSDIQEHCKDITNITEFFLEACLTDYENVGENATYILLVHNLIFYCQATFDIDECKLKEYFDYCTDTDEQSKTDIMLLIIIGVCCLIPLLLLLCCCCCWFHGLCCFKKCKQRRAVDQKDNPKKSFVTEEDENEDIAYSRSRINSRNSDFLFGENEGFNRLDSGMSTSRTHSALSASDFPIFFESTDDEMMSAAPPMSTLFTPVPSIPFPSEHAPRRKSSLLATLGTLIPRVKARPRGSHPTPTMQIQDASIDEYAPSVALPQPKTFTRQTNATPVFGKKASRNFSKQPAATPVFNKLATNSQKRPDSCNERPDSASSVGSRTKTRSPFVTPGNTDYSDREEVAYSPFQPQDTQSLSIVNRGYSPDIGDVGPVFPHTHRKSLPVLAEDGSIVPQTHRKSVPNVANKGNVSSFKHKPAAVPTKPKITFSENSGSTSRAANAIHGPDNHEEELIVRLPSYKAPSHGLLVDLDMELEKEKP